MKNPDYSIWVLEYAYVPDYPVSGVLYGAHNQGTLKLPYGYVVLKSSDRTVMVDAGYNYQQYGKVLADRFGVIEWQSPATVLGEIGVQPEDVSDIIITHAHFDHFGNVGDFPNATVHIQEREFSQWLWTLTLPPQFGWLQGALNPDDIVLGAHLAAEGRLHLVDGDVENLFPGIDVRAELDSHTFGSQYVVVNNGGGKDPWVLAGDLRYVRENITGFNDDGVYVPVGLAAGSQLNLLRASDHMMEAVDRVEKRVIAVHDEHLEEMFPSRKSKHGLAIVEITLAQHEASRV
ncbi:MAG: N-acyl homoserine lactonase family protein [Propionibacteriaceae bacterium]|nr:N-acyl homoserine lactonase family protein [Propionibacteriaceae bacterium]